MAEAKSKTMSLKLTKEAGNAAVKSASKDSVRSSFGKSLVKVGKELGKSNGREVDRKGRVKEEVKSPVKVVSKAEKAAVKQEAKPLVKVESKGGKKVSVKEEGNANGKELAKKVNGKDSVKAKEEEKGKTSVVKSSPVSTPVKRGSATKASPKSTKVGASSSVVKKKTVITETTVTTKIVTDQKKEKKVYTLPGQKHDPPEERDALRIFYSTLRDQKPESEMAEIWLMEYGLLPHDEAQKAFERKQRLRGQPVKSAAATKSSTPSRASNGSPAVKKSTPVSNGKGKSKLVSKKKRDASESDSDEEFLAKSVTKKKLKAASDSDDDFLDTALPRKKLKK